MKPKSQKKARTADDAIDRDLRRIVRRAEKLKLASEDLLRDLEALKARIAENRSHQGGLLDALLEAKKSVEAWPEWKKVMHQRSIDAELYFNGPGR